MACGDILQLRPFEIAGALLIELQRHEDERGFFARAFCEREFADAGVGVRMVQTNISWNRRRGTVRGMHFQKAPSEESKLVRCIRGRILDVLIDLRPKSSTYLRHSAVELDAESRRAVFIPHGVAHGFQTLVDDTEVLYQMSDYFNPELSAGVRWNDSYFGIRWPVNEVIIHPRDNSYPDFDPETVVLD